MTLRNDMLEAIGESADTGAIIDRFVNAGHRRSDVSLALIELIDEKYLSLGPDWTLTRNPTHKNRRTKTAALGTASSVVGKVG